MPNLSLCISFLLVFLSIPKVFGATCGVLKVQQSMSYGIEISNNPCKQAEVLSVGAAIKLHPNSRIWLTTTNSNNLAFKLICENQSSVTAEISVNSVIAPWVKAESDFKCKDWLERRLECTEPKTSKLALICAIAQSNRVQATHSVLQTASVTLRGLGSTIPPYAPSAQKNRYPSVFINQINSLAENCGQLFAQEVVIEWLINTEGNLAQYALQKGTEDEFTHCLSDALKASSFPKSQNATRIISTYR